MDLRRVLVEIRLSNDSLPLLKETCGMNDVVINLHLDLNYFKHVNILRQVNKTGCFLNLFQACEDIFLCKEALISAQYEKTAKIQCTNLVVTV